MFTNEEREYLISLIEADMQRGYAQPELELLKKLQVPKDHAIYVKLAENEKFQWEEASKAQERRALPANQSDPVTAIAQSIESLREAWNKS